MAGIPEGITTALVHLDAPISFIGQVGRIHATITSNVPLVWAATGTPIGNFVDNVSLDPGVPLELRLPHTDQAGFLDGSGNTITGWYYQIEITYERDGQNIPFPTRDFQIVGSQSNIDLALIPTGKAVVPATAPKATVMDVGGFTGSVTLEKLKLHLVDNTRDLDKPVSRAQAAINARKADIVNFTSGTNRFIRLATINGNYADSGATLTAILSGTGDYGDTDRGTTLIHVGQRAANVVDVKLWSFGVAETASPSEFYTVQTSTFGFELWVKVGTYTQAHSLQIMAITNAVITVDMMGLVAPVGTVAPTAAKLWPQIDMSRVSDVVTATNQATAASLVRRSTDGSAAFKTVTASAAPTANDHLARKDYVDTKAAAVTYATLGVIPSASLPALATSVAGRTGAVVLAKADVGLGNVDNTADTAKPVSTATQTALNAKAPLASPTFTGTVSGVTKAHVGLGNVTNTADADKPVSTAQAAAIAAAQEVAMIAGTPGYGTFAARPAASSLPVGSVYYSSDTQESYRASASGWVTVGAGGTNLATAKSTVYSTNTVVNTFADIPGLTATFMAGTRPVEVSIDMDIAVSVAGGTLTVEMVVGTDVVQELTQTHPSADKWSSVAQKVTLTNLTPGQSYTAKARIRASVGIARVDGGPTKPAQLTVSGR